MAPLILFLSMLYELCLSLHTGKRRSPAYLPVTIGITRCKTYLLRDRQISSLQLSTNTNHHTVDIQSVLSRLYACKAQYHARDVLSDMNSICEQSNISPQDLCNFFKVAAKQGIRVYPGPEAKNESPSYISSLERAIPPLPTSSFSQLLRDIAKSGITWSELTFPVQSSIYAKISCITVESTGNDIANTLKGLAEIKMPSFPNKDALRRLASAFGNTVKSMDVSSFSVALNHFSKFKVIWSDFPSDSQQSILQAMLKFRSFTAVSMSTTLYSFFRMRVKLSDFSEPVLTHLYHQIEKVVKDLPDRELANVMFALGRMSERDYDEENNAIVHQLTPRSLRILLLNSFSRLSPVMTAQGITNSLIGLGLLGVEWSTWSLDMQSNLIQVLRKAIPSMNIQCVSDCLYGCLLLKMRWIDIEDAGLDSLFYSVIAQKYGDITLFYFSSLISVLSSMTVQWSQLPNTVTDAFTLSLENLLTSCETEIECQRILSTSFYYLREMQLQWSDLTPSLVNVIEEKLVGYTGTVANDNNSSRQKYTKETADYFQTATISKENKGCFLYDSLECGLVWRNISPKFQEAILLNLEKSFSSLENYAKFRAIQGLSSLDEDNVSFSSFSPSFQGVLLEGLVSFLYSTTRSKQISAMLFHFSKLGVSWTRDLSSSVQSSIEVCIQSTLHASNKAYVSTLDISFILSALSRMSATWEVLTPVTQQTLLQSITSTIASSQFGNPNEINKILLGLMNLRVQWTIDLPKDVQQQILQLVQLVLETSPFSDFVSCLHLLSQCGLAWDDLPLPWKMQVFDKIVNYANQDKESVWDEITCAKIVSTFGNFHVRYDALSPNVQFSLQRLIESFGIPMKDQQSQEEWFQPAIIGSSTAESFMSTANRVSSTIVKGTNANANIEKRINTALITRTNRVTSTDINHDNTFDVGSVRMLLQGLLGMQYKRNSLSLVVQRTIAHSTLHYLSSSKNAMTAAMLLQGLSKLGFLWHEWSDAARRLIMKVVAQTVLLTGDSVASSICIQSLGQMEARYTYFTNTSPAFVRLFWRTVKHILEDGNKEAIAATILGLGTMGVPWCHINNTSCDSMPLEIRTVLVSTVLNQELWQPPGVTKRMLANIMYGTALMVYDLKLNKLAEEKKDDAGGFVADVIAIDTTLQNQLLTIMSSNARHGLTTENNADDDDDKKKENYEDTTEIGGDLYIEEQIATYRVVMDTLLPVASIPRAQHSALASIRKQLRLLSPLYITSPSSSALVAAKRRRRNTSQVHKSVENELHILLQQEEEAKLHIVSEFSCFALGIFPVDMAIFDNKYALVALLEIDGLHHYDETGQLRRKDELKEAIYAVRYPTALFLRVKVEDIVTEAAAEQASSASIVATVLQRILTHMKENAAVVDKSNSKKSATKK